MKRYKILLAIVILILMIGGLSYYRNYYVKDLLLNQNHIHMKSIKKIQQKFVLQYGLVG